MKKKVFHQVLAGVLTAAMVMACGIATPVGASAATTAKKAKKLSYAGYNLVWEDEFNGTELNRDDWNVELHEAGWVNQELQEYVDSSKNIQVKNGKLIIKPVRTKGKDGKYTYTSGRVNTQNKHDFKYGIMEAKIKFPEGQGYLPAFWMMPTDENLYGQWPKCGEIDIAEVMGQDTTKLYGTIHYGEPHAESQGTTTVTKKNNFADAWHTLAVEWEPGSIKWYLDGKLYHEANDWFTKTTNQGEVSYPAPFDQNFYLIFNLAVGGSWVGYPDKTTSFDTSMQVDYVKVYQKDSYDENVTKPVKKIKLKKADKNGNYITNSNFAKKEKLDGSKNWEFLQAQGGAGSATIKGKKIVIKTKEAGNEDYSIQLVQPGLPMEKGAKYQLTFDAYAAKARTMKVGISGPDMNYMRYFNDTTVKLTKKKKTYKYTFTMNEDTDANSRLEFNMGKAGSTATINITNVKLKKIKDATAEDLNKKTVLADGNAVYNGKFQEGTNRLGYWDIKADADAATISVTNVDYNDRKLAVEIAKDTQAGDITVGQSNLALNANNAYAITFDASATSARDITVTVAGQKFTASLTADNKSYEFKLKTPATLTDKNIVFELGGKQGTVYLDNVVVAEDSLLKNGSFNAGTAGWGEWHDSAADATFVIDSLSEDNAADFTINNNGNNEWDIQLQQKGITLEKGKFYKYTFDAKSSMNRQMNVKFQALEDRNYEVHSGDFIVDLTKNYKTYTNAFEMTQDTNAAAQLSICLGVISGKKIAKQHRVCVDNVTLEEITKEEYEKLTGSASTGDTGSTGDEGNTGNATDGNMIKNGNFASSANWEEWHDSAEATAEYEIKNGEVHFKVSKTGTEDWKIQLKQENIKLENGKYYKLEYSAKSDLARQVRVTLQDNGDKGYIHYTGEYFVTLEKDYKKYTKVFKMTGETFDKIHFGLNLGTVTGDKEITKEHNVYLKDVSLVEITEAEYNELNK